MAKGDATAPDDSALEPAGDAALTGRARLLQVLVRPSRPVVMGFSITIGVLLAGGLALTVVSLSTVLMSIMIAVFLALAIDPAVKAMERRGIKRSWGIIIVTVIFLAIVAVIAFVLVPLMIRQLVGVVQGLPVLLTQMAQTQWFQSLSVAMDADLESFLRDAIASATNLGSFLTVSGGVLRAGVGALGGVFGGISSTMLIVVLTLYFVASLEQIKGAVASVVPAYQRPGFTSLINEISTAIGSFVAGGILISTLNGAFVLIVQLLIGSPFAVLLAIMAFFISLVPMLGSVLVWIIASTITLFVDPVAALIFAIAYLVYMQVEAYGLGPRILGKKVAVPGVLIIIGAMGGAALGGLLGALVAIPIVASVLIIVRKVLIPIQDARTGPAGS